MNTRLLTREIQLNDTIRAAAEQKSTRTMQVQKPACENGVCSVSWKPVKPTAA